MDEQLRDLQRRAQLPDRAVRDKLFGIIQRLPAEFGAMKYRPYRCDACGHEQLESTNHTGQIYMIYCKNCSWKARRPNFNYSGYEALEGWKCVCTDCQEKESKHSSQERNPMKATFAPENIVKISLPIPKHNYDGSRSTKGQFAGESPWAYHLSGRSLLGFDDIGGGYGIGILLNELFFASYAQRGDLLIYGQREGLIPQVIDAIPLPENITPLPQFASEDEFDRGFARWLQKNRSALPETIEKLLDSYKLKARRAIPKLTAAPICARCGELWNVWMVSNAKWSLVGRRWLKELLCWKCYRQLTKDKGGATKRMTHAYLMRRADRRHQRRIEKLRREES